MGSSGSRSAPSTGRTCWRTSRQRWDRRSPTRRSAPPSVGGHGVRRAISSPGMKASELIEQAQQRTGLRDFDSESFLEGLEMLAAGIERRSDYTRHGLAIFGDELGRYLDN